MQPTATAVSGMKPGRTRGVSTLAFCYAFQSPLQPPSEVLTTPYLGQVERGSMHFSGALALKVLLDALQPPFLYAAVL